MHSIGMVLNQHHRRRNSLSYSVDDEHYEEEYPVFGYSISIAKKGSNYDKLYVCYDIRDESDMYLLSDPDMSPSENVIILVYQILSIQLKSLVLRIPNLPSLDAIFLALNLPALGSFLLSTIQTNSAARKRQVLLDNYDEIMCKCLWRRSDSHVCKLAINAGSHKRFAGTSAYYLLKLQFQGECDSICFGDLNSIRKPFLFSLKLCLEVDDCSPF